VICLDPIAYFSSESLEKADVPRQACLASANRGVLRFVAGKNFEQALEDLEGTTHIWVLFWMNQVTNWKAKIKPPRNASKKGVFSTRSPHRPNPIGLSCVRLVKVSGLKVTIEGHDLLDGTPILDIKPYLAYADSFPDAQVGWMQNMGPLQENLVVWSELAQEQVRYIDAKGLLQKAIEERLRFFLEPTSSNRVCFLEKDFYLQAYKQWRFVIQKKEQIQILAIFSGNLEQESEFDRQFAQKLSRFLQEKGLLSKLQGKVYF
jgi:tRNA-Thr(GGU) m(6)t(6)A37 methyltransferase TsaA